METTICQTKAIYGNWVSQIAYDFLKYKGCIVENGNDECNIGSIVTLVSDSMDKIQVLTQNLIWTAGLMELKIFLIDDSL